MSSTVTSIHVHREKAVQLAEDTLNRIDALSKSVPDLTEKETKELLRTLKSENPKSPIWRKASQQLEAQQAKSDMSKGISLAANLKVFFTEADGQIVLSFEDFMFLKNYAKKFPTSEQPVADEGPQIVV